MHEIGVVRQMCRTVMDFAAENNIQSISEIVVEIGELSLIIPKYVEDVYPLVTEGTMLSDTKLIMETVPGLAECDDCDDCCFDECCDSDEPICCYEDECACECDAPEVTVEE